jgi:hypothetical protein
MLDAGDRALQDESIYRPKDLIALQLAVETR